jgi:release factor glutamine methyltransferase
MSLIYEPKEDSYFLSEILKKEIPRLIKENKNLKILEIGVGSGIQLENLKELGIKNKNLFGVDINKEAIKHCRELGFNVWCSNLFLNIDDKFDLILFNPPYLPEDKREDNQSKLATTGGRNGFELINKFLRQAKKHLNKNGKIFLLASSLTKEINWGNYKKKLIAKKKLFFEELYVWKIEFLNTNL